ncbi:MAG: hypothetical protein ACLRY6_01415 [[Clostridium] innocuum]
MKKYNILILSCFLLYLGIAAFLGWSILQMEETMDHAYRVEINRILQQVEKGTKAEDIAQEQLSAYRKAAMAVRRGRKQRNSLCLFPGGK